MEDENLFKNWMTMFGEKYEKQFSSTMLKMIWEALEHFSDEACEKAFKIVFAHGRFFKDILPDILDRLGQSSDDQAIRAWQKVQKAVQSLGPYHSVSFDDKVIHLAIDAMGGWTQFQDCSLRDWEFRRKEFEKLYVSFTKNPTKIMPMYLPGIVEKKNRAFGFYKNIPPPICIGESEETGKIYMIEANREGQMKRIGNGD